jgi:LPXTG-site transpeptidase (sortase) family protein
VLRYDLDALDDRERAVARADHGGPPRRPRRRLRQVLLALLGAFGGLLLFVGGLHAYVLVADWLAPPGRVYVTIDGQQRYLEQPQVVVTPRPQAIASPRAASPGPPGARQPTPLPARPPAPTAAQASPATASSSLAAETPLPPLHLAIPAIAVDVPVVLADNQNLPRVKVAGWFFRSAFPATAGNLVLLGHVDGKAETFGRLAELRPGDQVRVFTADRVHVYVVDTAEVVDDQAVEVLAPTPEPVVTLITCAGDWNPTTRSYNERLVVRGHYAAVEARTDAP